MKKFLIFLTLASTALADRRAQLLSQKSVTPFSPSSIAGLYGWYRADLLALNDGDAVTSFPDQSGLANTLAKAGGTITFHTNQINGLPTISMRGVGDLTRNSINLSPAGPITLGGSVNGVTQFLVVRRHFNASFPSLYITSPNFANSAGAILTDTTGGANTVFSVDGSFQLTESINNYQVISVRLTNTTTLVQIKTSNQTSGGSGGSDVSDTNMGIDNGEVDLAEMLWYRLPLSDADIASVRSYLASKYGL